MKILVVFTGGTIGSSVNSEGFFAPTEQNGYRLLELYKEVCEKGQIRPLNYVAEKIEIDTVAPYTTLSENLNGWHVEQLVACLEEYVKEDYEGIIVTHGTDTLQYTAAALGYAFGNDTIPIVLVSSNYILDDERANGLANFVGAVEFISQKAGRGVFVSYQNTGEITKFHRGTRLMAHPVYEDGVFSVGDQYYASLADGKIVPNPIFAERADETDTVKTGWSEHESGVLWLNPHPGMSYPVLDASVKAVLFSTYHSGTICTDSMQWKSFMEEASKKQIPVFLTGAIKEAVYESTKPLKSLGVQILPKGAPIAMCVKLAMGIALGVDLHDLMYKSLGGDVM